MANTKKQAKVIEPEIKAIARGISISPRKVGVVADLVRRRSVQDALTMLSHTERRASGPVTKTINSAVANAKNNLRMPADQLDKLIIKKIMVTEGTMLKRGVFVGSGRRTKMRPMLKRSSHLTVILALPTAVLKESKNQDIKKAVKSKGDVASKPTPKKATVAKDSPKKATKVVKKETKK